MTERYYRIAGATIRVIGPEDKMYEEDGILAPFRTEVSLWDHTLEIELVDELSPPLGELIFTGHGRQVYRAGDACLRYNGSYIRILRRDDHSLVQLDRRAVWDRITPKIVLNAMEMEHMVAKERGFLLHATYIRRKDQGILFTAPSGNGKSTQADLWCRLRGAELLNGDRAAVLLEPEGVTVHGVPFSGSSGVSENVTLPLAAIVYLSQSPVTTISPLDGLRAFRCIWEGCSFYAWDREDVSACTQTILETLQRVPAFHLACTPDETAVTALEKELEKLR